MVALAALRRGATRVHVETRVHAARGGHEFGRGAQRRLPVEDDTVTLADDDGRARLGPSTDKAVFDAQLGQAIGQVAHGLFVLEVRLLNPAHGLIAQHAIEVAVGATLDTDRVVLLFVRARPQDDALGRRLRGQLGAMFGDDLAQGEGHFTQTLVRDGGDLEHAVAARLELGPHELGQLATLGHVDLVERDQLRTLEEGQLVFGHGIRAQFRENHVEV